MAEELYRFIPWLRNVTGREEGVSREQQHKNLKNKIAKHLIKAGVERPAGAAPIGEDPSKVQPSTGSGSGGSDERTSSKGVVQKGQTLGGVNNILKGFGAGELADVSTTYQSAALPATLSGVTQLEKPLVEGATPTQKPDVSDPFQSNPQTQSSFPEGTKPFASTDSYTPYSTGGNPSNAQDGSSPQPDRVERLRQIGFNGADFSGDEPDDSTLVSPMYANKKRNEIRRTFLDYEGSSVKAAVAANAVAGYGKDSNGNARFNVGGELVNAKEGMEWKAKDAAMRGVDPSEFLQTKVAEVKEAAKTDPETPVETVAPSTSSTMTPGLTLEEGNIEYGAMKFVRDPKTNSMVPAK